MRAVLCASIGRIGWHLVACTVALAMSGNAANGHDFVFHPEGGVALNLAGSAAEGAVPDSIAPKFADAGSVRMQVGGMGAYDFDDVSTGLAIVSVSYFILDGLSLDVEAEFGYIGQSEGDDGVGGGTTFLVRWHAIREPTWSIYGEFGIGLFFSSVDVPVGGGQVNFNPQAGAGVSFELTEDVRMMLGARWTHLSNARTLADNPGVDQLGIYAFISIGF